MSEHKCRNCGSSERYIKGPMSNCFHWHFLAEDKKFTIQVCGGYGLVEWLIQAPLFTKVKDSFGRAV